jgi:hypothetical protein
LLFLSKGEKVDKLLARLKKEWDENPLQVIVVGSLAVTAVAKLIDARTASYNRRTWSREVSRRERNSR